LAESESPKRPTWFWPVVAIVVLVLAAGGFAAPSVMECSSSSDGFGACINSKLAGLGLVPQQAGKSEHESTAVAVAQPADTAELPPAVVAPPDFGVRVEPDGSIVVIGSGATGKTVQIFVNGELFGTADVEPTGDWVLVPEAPLPPGDYELTLVDPETGIPLDKSYVVALNEDRTSEPLVVAATPGKASEILQGLAEAAGTAVATAEAETPVVETSTATEPVAMAEAEIPAQTPVAAPEETTDQVETPSATIETPSAEAETPAELAVATAGEDVVGDVDALQKRIEALAKVAPSIDAIEIDNDRNFFAGTGADGAVIRLYVDNVFVGDVEVKQGRWLLETDNVLKNRSQRVRADQLLSGTAEVASRAEIDFIFEEPQAAPTETAVAEAPVTVPQADFGIDTDEPVVVPDEPEPAPVAVAEAETTEPAAETAAPVTVAGTDVAGSTAAEGTGTAAASAGTAVAVPEPDFSIDTGIPVTVVSAPTADTVQVAEATEPADTAQVAETTAPVEPVAVPVAPAEEPVAVATADIAAEEPVAVEPDVPHLVAMPIGRPELGRFATGKAIIRKGDNLWTIARRVYGSGYEYIQIYGANRDQIRDPDLIYPGQVFDLPDIEVATASSN
jgi:nucleoid-associated protein YgaU